jgi:hypothetical protein
VTVDLLTLPAFYTVSGTGPYAATFPYQAGAVRVFVEQAGQRVLLAADTFTVTPASTDADGSVFLTPEAALLHAGKRLWVVRDTGVEQGWAGQNSREKGLEAQLDQLVMALQEAEVALGTAVRTQEAVAPVVPVPGAAIIFDELGRPIAGPTVAQIAGAQAAADAALAAQAITEVARDEAVEAAGSIVSADLIERSVVGDGTIASLTFPGVYTRKANFLDVMVGNVAQGPDRFTLTQVGLNTVLTFSEPVPVGLVAQAKASSRLVSDVTTEGAITDLSRKAVADRSAALAWIAANAAPPVGFVLSWSGVGVRYIGSGTVIPDMPGYVPDGVWRLEHAGGGTSATAAQNRAALDAAQAGSSHCILGPGFYNFGTEVYEITKPSFTLEAEVAGRTSLFWSGATASGLRVRPANTENGSWIDSVRLLGFGITHSAPLTHTSGIGLEIIMANTGQFDLTVSGWERGVRLAGGQLNVWRRMAVFARTGGVVPDVTGSYCLYVGPHIQADLTPRHFYTTRILNIFASGSPNKNVEHTIRLGGSDGLTFGEGDVNFGRTSNMYVSPDANGSEGNITATDTGAVYFDGVGQVTGTEYGIMFAATAFTGRVNNFRIGSATFIGNYQKSAIYSRGNALLGLFIDGANLSGCSERVVDIEGVTGSSGTRIVIGGSTQIRDGTLGGVRIVGARAIQITGCAFSDNSGTDGALLIDGTVSDLVVRGNSYVGNSADFTKATATQIRPDAIQLPFTPSVRIGTTLVSAAGHDVQEGQYSLDNGIVTFDCRVLLNSKESLTGAVEIAGLPFVRGGNALINPIAIVTPLTGSSVQAGVVLTPGDIVAGTLRVRLRKATSQGTTSVSDTDITTTFACNISGSYRI